jgi:biopolymer transport protein ExbD
MSRRIRLIEDDAHDEPHINLTALIDVVFVVLITFMIIAPILDIDRVQLAQGPTKTEDHISPQSSDPFSITVRADNTIWVEQKPIALSDLSSWLKRQKATRPRAIPKLIHDSRASFGTYQAIKNTVEACGFEEMDVVLQPH